MVEGTGLEIRHTGNRIEGSTPSLSAIKKPRITPVFLCPERAKRVEGLGRASYSVEVQVVLSL